MTIGAFAIMVTGAIVTKVTLNHHIIAAWISY